jgi:hypothetical protein
MATVLLIKASSSSVGSKQTMATQGYSKPPFQHMVQQYVDPAVAGWFRHVDTDRSGLIDAKELNSALSLGGWISFSVESTTAMIRMFNKDGTGNLTLEEFQHLVNYLNNMRYNFMQLDQDRSGRLDFGEIHRALHLSGHNVDFLQLSKLLHKLDRQKNNSLALDGYIELCLFLGQFAKFSKNMTLLNNSA